MKKVFLIFLFIPGFVYGMEDLESCIVTRSEKGSLSGIIGNMPLPTSMVEALIDHINQGTETSDEFKKIKNRLEEQGLTVSWDEGRLHFEKTSYKKLKEGRIRTNYMQVSCPLDTKLLKTKDPIFEHLFNRLRAVDSCGFDSRGLAMGVDKVYDSLFIVEDKQVIDISTLKSLIDMAASDSDEFTSMQKKYLKEKGVEIKIQDSLRGRLLVLEKGPSYTAFRLDED